MRILRRGSALTLAAAAVGAAYLGWTGSPSLVATHTPPRTVEQLAVGGDGAVTPGPDALAMAADCPFCLEETDFAAFGAEPELVGDQVFGVGPADFDDGLNTLAGLATGSTATATPEISTAAMLTLGLVALTAWRRKGRARWAPWRLPAAVQTV